MRKKCGMGRHLCVCQNYAVYLKYYTYFHFLLKSFPPVERYFHHVSSHREVGWKYCTPLNHHRIHSVQNLSSKLHICLPPCRIVDWHFMLRGSKNGCKLLIVLQLGDITYGSKNLKTVPEDSGGEIDILHPTKYLIRGKPAASEYNGISGFNA